MLQTHLSFLPVFLLGIRQFFCFVDLVPPVLTLIFIKQVVIILPCPQIKLSFVLQRLRFPAFFTAQLIPLAFCQEKAAAHFALPKMQPPVFQPVQIINHYRIKRRICAGAFQPGLMVGVPQVKPCVFRQELCWEPVRRVRGPAHALHKIRRGVCLKCQRKGAYGFYKAVTCGAAVPVFPCRKAAFPYAESRILPHRISKVCESAGN